MPDGRGTLVDCVTTGGSGVRLGTTVLDWTGGGGVAVTLVIGEGIEEFAGIPIELVIEL